MDRGLQRPCQPHADPTQERPADCALGERQPRWGLRRRSPSGQWEVNSVKPRRAPNPRSVQASPKCREGRVPDAHHHRERHTMTRGLLDCWRGTPAAFPAVLCVTHLPGRQRGSAPRETEVGGGPHGPAQTPSALPRGSPVSRCYWPIEVPHAGSRSPRGARNSSLFYLEKSFLSLVF